MTSDRVQAKRKQQRSAVEQASPAKASEQADLALKYFCEVQWAALTDTANLVTKGITFYLAIIAALTGYLFGKQLPVDLQRLAFYLGISVSTVAIIAAASVGWGLDRGLLSFERCCRRLDRPLFDELEITRFFRRGRRVMWITVCCAFAVLLFLVAGLARISNWI